MHTADVVLEATCMLEGPAADVAPVTGYAQVDSLYVLLEAVALGEPPAAHLALVLGQAQVDGLNVNLKLPKELPAEVAPVAADAQVNGVHVVLEGILVTEALVTGHAFVDNSHVD